MILLLLSWFFILAYAALMGVYKIGWQRQKLFVADGDFKPQTFISIVIPARNEAKNIAACIHSILANNYPENLFEIIVVDDHSEDETAMIVERISQPNVHLLKLENFLSGESVNAYKKKALTVGISKSKGALILTTDADCIAPKNWLREIASIFEKQHPVMIIAPVDFITAPKLVQVFQSLDFMTMQGITMATHALKMGNMSNGANLAFSKEAFLSVDGYTGVDHLASGDDFLLMMKLQKAYPQRISCLKSAGAIVRTAPQPDWKSFLNQRIRWASKSGKYNDPKITATLLLVYGLNLWLLLLFVLGFADFFWWKIGLLMLVVKTVAELLFLLPVAHFFNKQKQLLWFPFLQPLHICYIVLAGLLGFAGVYKWKGRRVK